MTRVACLCPTFCRHPDQLANIIACFEWQDYPYRELIIVDDAGQYENQSGPDWQLVSFPRRFRTLGEKRNAIAGLISPDTEILAVWDSDDAYLPHHLSTLVKSLESIGHYHAYAIPTQLYQITRGRVIRVNNSAQKMYHGAWGYYRKLFIDAGGYPAMQSGQDQHLRVRFEQLGATRVDPCQTDSRPSYFYSWYHRKDSFHVSAEGGEGNGLYERWSERRKPWIGKIYPKLELDWQNLAENAFDTRQ